MKQRLLGVKGMSLVEILMASAIAVLMLAGLATLISKNARNMQQSRVQQEVMRDARISIDTVGQMLGYAKASSLVISTRDIGPPGGDPPNSQVDFDFKAPTPSGATAYRIYLENGVVYTQEFAPGSERAPQAIASHVSGLVFTCDSKDPGLLSVSLQIDAPTTTVGDVTEATSVLLPSRVIRLTD